MSNLDLNAYFENIERDDYQRDNFDSFLKKVSFKYNVPSIHIAGSNGKGSTANYLANIYKASGYKVGLFTSPYLDIVNEMIQINGEMISDEVFYNYIKQNEKLINKYELSPFEIQVYVALTYFENEKCDIAIIECGMGGEIDATNIFTPVVSVITSISLEHTAFLGRSISEIAYSKAGIIKEEVPVITGILDEEAINTIVNVAKGKSAPVSCAVDPANVVYNNFGYNFAYMTYAGLHINSAAAYSLKDACIALEVISKCLERFPVSEENIKEGLNNTFMPVRMEVVDQNPLTVIDGSHNPEGVQNMVKSLPYLAESKEIHVIFACFKDKNIERMLAFLGEYSKDIRLTTFPHKRARTMEDYFLYLDDHSFQEDPLAIYEELKAQYPEDMILITGSLAFAAYMKNILKKG